MKRRGEKRKKTFPLAALCFLFLGFWSGTVRPDAPQLLIAAAEKRNLYFLLGIVLLLRFLYRALYARSGRRTRRGLEKVFRWAVLLATCIMVIFPLVWWVLATFQEDASIFSFQNFSVTLEGYAAALQGDSSFPGALLNSAKYSVPSAAFAVLSSAVTAFGFERFRFKGRRILLAILMATIFLPPAALAVPQYGFFHRIGWIDHPLYLPLTLPSLFAQNSLLVLAFMQVLKRIPREVDESAKLEGCGELQTFRWILFPMMRPVWICAGVGWCISSTNDLLGPLLYVTSRARYPVSLFLRMNLERVTGFSWNHILTEALLSVIPAMAGLCVVHLLCRRIWMTEFRLRHVSELD